MPEKGELPSQCWADAGSRSQDLSAVSGLSPSTVLCHVEASISALWFLWNHTMPPPTCKAQATSVLIMLALWSPFPFLVEAQ